MLDYSGYFDWYNYGVPYPYGPARQATVCWHGSGRWTCGILTDVGGIGYEPVAYGSVRMSSLGRWREDDELWAPFLSPSAESTPRLLQANQADFWIDDASGMLLLMAQQASDGWWGAIPAKLDVEPYFGVPPGYLIWRTQGEVAVVAATANSPGSLWRRADGTWEFAYVPAGTPSTYNIIRCRALAGDGSGSWA